MELASLIASHAEQLTAAERRAADVVLTRPELVAFGTVAELAAHARTSGATVVRLAAKLGYDGFSALQDQVQKDLGRRLRPAAERIRQPALDDVVGRTTNVELDNVQATLERVDAEAFTGAATALSDVRHRVFVLSGEASRGIGVLLVHELSMLRDGVVELVGSEVAVLRQLALAESGDTCIVLDHRRYERWVVGAVRHAADRGLRIIALSDSALSPLAQVADVSFVVSATGAGPFDSHVGALALVNALITAVADGRKAHATDRLDKLEGAWSAAGALIDQ
jgi:DNA-binding MurR/RpiR family transcriptional regulator